MSNKHCSSLLQRRLASSSPFTRSTQSTASTISSGCSSTSCRLTTTPLSSPLSSSHTIVVGEYHHYSARRGYAALGARGGAMPSPHSAEHFFVQFQETPNEECMKFFVEGQHFLLPLDAATIHRAAPIARKPVDITKKRVLLVKKKSTPTAADDVSGGDTSSSLHPHLRNLVSEDAFEGGSHHEEQYTDGGYGGGVAASKAQKAAMEDAVADGDASLPIPSLIPAATNNVAAARAMPMTMSFDKSNNFLSPLAQSLMEGCPMIEEVTVGHSFITVRRIPEDQMVERLIEAEAQEVKQVDLFKGAHPPGGKPKSTEGGPTETPSSSCCKAPSASSAEEGIEAAPITSRVAAEDMPPPPAAPHREAAPASTVPEAAPVTPIDKVTPDTLVTKTSPPSDASTDANRGAIVEEERKEETSKTPADGDDVPVSESDEAKYRKAAHGALSWGELQFTISALLMDHLFTGAPHITPGAPHPHPDTLPVEGDSEVMLVIKELVSDVIRPLVQQDGGDIRLVKFEPISAEPAEIAAPAEVKAADEVASTALVEGGNVKGRVWVEMLGACKSCKSSKTTLKDLIERTIQHWVPEVHEVVEFDAIAKAKAQEEMKLMMQKAFEARRAASEAAAAAVAAKAAATPSSESGGSDDQSSVPQAHEEEIPEMDLP